MSLPSTSPRERKLAYLAWLVVCVVWGTTYLGIRVSLESIPVFLLAGIRWTAAGLLLATLLPLVGDRLPPPRIWGSIAIAGFLMAVIGNGGVVWAQQYVASGLAAVVVAMRVECGQHSGRGIVAHEEEQAAAIENAGVAGVERNCGVDVDGHRTIFLRWGVAVLNVPDICPVAGVSPG